jgi:hypothetical protein
MSIFGHPPLTPHFVKLSHIYGTVRDNNKMGRGTDFFKQKRKPNSEFYSQTHRETDSRGCFLARGFVWFSFPALVFRSIR